MDQNQRELRRAAAKAFQASLEQLGQSFQPGQDKTDETHSTESPTPPRAPQPPPTQDAAIDVKALEEAAADIEQFMQSRDCEK